MEKLYSCCIRWLHNIFDRTLSSICYSNSLRFFSCFFFTSFVSFLFDIIFSRARNVALCRRFLYHNISNVAPDNQKWFSRLFLLFLLLLLLWNFSWISKFFLFSFHTLLVTHIKSRDSRIYDFQRNWTWKF